MSVAQTASAQVTVTVTDCADFPVANPGVADAGATVNIDTGAECTVTAGDHVELEDNAQDDVTINIASGTTLTNADLADENVVIFIDNAENNTTINIDSGATLNGANGVIFVEGDGARIVNAGSVIGTGSAEEGVIYFDRDTDSDENRLINTGTGQIIAQDGGPAVGIEVLLADGQTNPEDVGVQDPIADFPTFRIVNRSGGLIQASATSNGDNDGINIAGHPGSAGGLDRACIEGSAINCNVNLRLLNFGTIESTYDNFGNAGIVIEDGAVFHGAILNNVGGVITGIKNGIRIGDVDVDGATAEHTGIIRNRGTISGTGASGRGIDLEGDGITIVNTATGVISGTNNGIVIGAGNTGGTPNSGVNNRIINSGTISGANQAIDSQNAAGSIFIDSRGGFFDGTIRGSVANVDVLRISFGATNLTHDVLQNFSVRVNPDGILNFVGDRTIEGELFGLGTFGFDLSNTQTVTGDVFLRAGSTVAISDASEVAGVGEQFTLINVGGTLTNDATLDASQAIADNSAMLDFNFVDSTDLVVEAVADMSAAKMISYSSDATRSFGETVLGAFGQGDLNGTSAFSTLASFGDVNSVGNVLETLAPDFSGNIAQNIYSSVQNGKVQIAQRMNDLDCNLFYDPRESSSLNTTGIQTCQSFAQTGSWVQVATPYAVKGSLSLSAPSTYGFGGDDENLMLTYGYDQVVDNNTIIGLTGSYTRTEADNDAFSVSSTDLDVMQFSAYAGHRVGNMNLVTKASFSSGQAETRRQSYEVIKADVGFRGLNVESVASYDVNLGKGLYLKPEAGLLYDNLTTNAYTEAGGLNLDVSETGSNVLDARMGVTLGARRQITDTLRADVYIGGAIVDDIYGQRDDLNYSFGGQSGSLASRQLENFAVQGLMGVNLLSSEKFSFGAALNSEFSGSENAIGTSVQTKLRW